MNIKDFMEKNLNLDNVDYVQDGVYIGSRHDDIALVTDREDGFHYIFMELEGLEQAVRYAQVRRDNAERTGD